MQMYHHIQIKHSYIERNLINPSFTYCVRKDLSGLTCCLPCFCVSSWYSSEAGTAVQVSHLCSLGAPEPKCVPRPLLPGLLPPHVPWLKGDFPWVELLHSRVLYLFHCLWRLLWYKWCPTILGRSGHLNQSDFHHYCCSRHCSTACCCLSGWRSYLQPGKHTNNIYYLINYYKYIICDIKFPVVWISISTY